MRTDEDDPVMVHDKDTVEGELAQELASQGIDAAYLIEHYEPSLKRFWVDVGMGEFDSHIRNPAPGEHPLLPVAESFLYEALCYPYRDEFYGFRLAGKFDRVFTKCAENSIRNMDDWFAGSGHWTPELVAFVRRKEQQEAVKRARYNMLRESESALLAQARDELASGVITTKEAIEKLREHYGLEN